MTNLKYELSDTCPSCDEPLSLIGIVSDFTYTSGRCAKCRVWIRVRTVHEVKEMDTNEMLGKIEDFALKHEDSSLAAKALMSFFRGDCIHFRSDCSDNCELCGYLMD